MKFTVSEIETMLNKESIVKDGLFYCVHKTTVLVSSDGIMWDSLTLKELEAKENHMKTIKSERETKRCVEDLSWNTTTIDKIDVGQYISKIYSTHPRKITRIDKEGETIKLYCDTLDGMRYPYIIGKVGMKIDLLMDQRTKDPIYDLSLYGVNIS